MPDTRRSLSSLQTLLADNTAGDISAQDGRDVLVSNHPENVHPTAAFASTPSTPLTGDIWLPTDSFYLERYSGSAFVPWGPIFPMTAPIDGDFAWINQGTGVKTTTNGGVNLTDTANAAAWDLVIRKKSAPATPYTITAWFLGQVDPVGFGNFGLCFRQASDGKLHTYSVWISPGATAPALIGAKMTNATTASADYENQGAAGRVDGPICLRIADNGTNRICSVSRDGVNFLDTHSIGRTDFLTADEVGFYINPWSANTTVTLLSWKEA